MANEVERFKQVTAKNYQDQGEEWKIWNNNFQFFIFFRKLAIFFLNAYWPEHSKDAEDVWQYWQRIVSLDTEKKKEGRDLGKFENFFKFCTQFLFFSDEFWAHRFLELSGVTKRVVEVKRNLFLWFFKNTKTVFKVARNSPWNR